MEPAGDSSPWSAVCETIFPPSFLFGTECLQSVPIPLLRVRSPSSGTSMHPEIVVPSLTKQMQIILKTLARVLRVWVRMAPNMNMHRYTDPVLISGSPHSRSVQILDPLEEAAH
jgi:hypothetical protein